MSYNSQEPDLQAGYDDHDLNGDHHVIFDGKFSEGNLQWEFLLVYFQWEKLSGNLLRVIKVNKKYIQDLDLHFITIQNRDLSFQHADAVVLSDESDIEKNICNRQL